MQRLYQFFFFLKINKNRATVPRKWVVLTSLFFFLGICTWFAILSLFNCSLSRRIIVKHKRLLMPKGDCFHEQPHGAHTQPCISWCISSSCSEFCPISEFHLISEFSPIISTAPNCSQGYLADIEDNPPSHQTPLGYDMLTHSKPRLLAWNIHHINGALSQIICFKVFPFYSHIKTHFKHADMNSINLYTHEHI